MSILKSASLTGVWGERDIVLNFRSDVNFLIGPNGSGKTTAINLIAAMLTAEYDSLARIPFREMKCVLNDPENTAGDVVISVIHSVRESPFPSLEFTYTIIRGKEKRSFTLGASSLRYISTSPLGRATARPTQIDADVLSEIVRIKWLSVHRTPSKSRSGEQPSSDPSVDRRLTQIGNQLVRYFSKIAAKREEETSRFLKQLFPILFSTASEENAIGEALKIDFASLKESITDLIQQFGLASKTLDKNLRMHFRLADAAKNKAAYSSAEITALVSSIPMRKVVEEWKRSLVRQANIAKPRREFIEVINSMFSGKHLVINQRNELEALLPTDKRLQLSDLSSGEKQLLIIMAEALLQENAVFVYIADEPELSLHVRWQEQLTRNLRRINPKAQVIFATHSPDIVSEYGDRVIDMERIQ